MTVLSAWWMNGLEVAKLLIAKSDKNCFQQKESILQATELTGLKQKIIIVSTLTWNMLVKRQMVMSDTLKWQTILYILTT